MLKETSESIEVLVFTLFLSCFSINSNALLLAITYATFISSRIIPSLAKLPPDLRRLAISSDVTSTSTYLVIVINIMSPEGYLLEGIQDFGVFLKRQPELNFRLFPCFRSFFHNCANRWIFSFVRAFPNAKIGDYSQCFILAEF